MSYDSQEILYQYAPTATWPTTDPGWTTDDAIDIIEASDGLGAIVGSGTARKRYGRLRRPLATGSAADEDPPTIEPSLGHYCRLLRPDPAGTITVFSQTWSAFWWGFSARARRRFFGKVTGWPVSATTDFELVGLAGLLEQISVIDGLEMTDTAPHPWEIYRAPDFNANGRPNMYRFDVSVNGSNCRVFDHFNLLTGSDVLSWTVTKAITYLLAYYTPRHGGPWTVVDSSFDAGLEVLPPTACHGRTLLQLINEILNPARGLSYQIDVAPSGVPRLTIVDDPPLSGSTLDVSTAADFADVALEQDTVGASADEVTILSARPPLDALTFVYKSNPALPGVTLAADGWTFGPPTDFPDANEKILRTYAMNATFLDDLRVELDDPGTGYNGDRIKASDNGGGPSARGVKLERLSPLPARSIGSGAALTARSEDDRGPPRVFVRWQVGTFWEDFSDRLHVTVANDPARIELSGNPDAFADLYRYLLGGGEMRITIGVRELAPLRLSSRVTSTLRGKRDLIRVLADADAYWVPAGTALYVAGSNLVTQSPGDVDTWSPAAIPMDDELDRVARYAQGAMQQSLSFQRRGLHFDNPPGTAFSGLATGNGVIALKTRVTRRRWTFGEGQLTTSWETTRPTYGSLE